MEFKNYKKLKECTLSSNCILVEWKFKDINQVFKDLIKISCEIPRTSTVEQSKDYWHGICRSLIFRFPDDLEILKLENEGIIQVKSSSRFGVSDLGVNRQRVTGLYRKILKNSNR